MQSPRRKSYILHKPLYIYTAIDSRRAAIHSNSKREPRMWVLSLYEFCILFFFSSSLLRFMCERTTARWLLSVFIITLVLNVYSIGGVVSSNWKWSERETERPYKTAAFEKKNNIYLFFGLISTDFSFAYTETLNHWFLVDFLILIKRHDVSVLF